MQLTYLNSMWANDLDSMNTDCFMFNMRIPVLKASWINDETCIESLFLKYTMFEFSCLFEINLRFVGKSFSPFYH